MNLVPDVPPPPPGGAQQIRGYPFGVESNGVKGDRPLLGRGARPHQTGLIMVTGRPPPKVVGQRVVQHSHSSLLGTCSALSVGAGGQGMT